MNSVALSSSDCHAVGFVLQRTKAKLDLVKLSRCSIDEHGFSHIAAAIQEMPGSVSKVLADFKSLNPVDIVKRL